MGRGGKTEREAREAVEVNNVLNLSLQTPRIPAIVKQMEKDEGGGKGGKGNDGRTWNGNRAREEVVCFCVSINVGVVKCLQGRRGAWGTGRAPYKRE